MISSFYFLFSGWRQEVPLHSLRCVERRAFSPSCEQATMPTPHGLVRNHSFHFRRVRIADQHIAAQLAFALLVLRGQDVPQEGMRHLDLSCRGLLESLGGAFVC